MPVDVKVPSPGESITEVFIGTWLKQEGDAVQRDEALVEVETDKATLEVPAPVGGKIVELLKSEGDTAAVGEVIARIEEGEAADAEEAPATEGSGADEEPAAADAEEREPEEDGEPAEEDGGEGHVMPAARRLLEEEGVSAERVDGTGKGGRVLKEDVQRFLASREGSSGGAAEREEPREATGATPGADPHFGGGTAGERQEETVPMSPLRRRIAQRLVEAQQTAALLTTFNEIDMTAVMALRGEFKESFQEAYGTRLGFMSFFVKASIDALKRFPQLNAEIRDQSIVYKNFYDIGVAVSTDRGLIVPVIRSAEQLSFAEIEETITDFGRRAGTNKLSPSELQGGTFTITNGGVFGSLMSTPIVNPPQSGVLGMHAIQQRPVAIDGQVEIRPMMYVALTYDHRIVDGREAVTFLKRIKDAIESPSRMLLEI